MEGLLLKKAFCCRLERFGLIIGYIQLGLSAFLGVIYLIALICARFGSNIFHEHDISTTGSSIVTGSLLSILTSGMLVFGIKRERHQFMTPWLIVSVIEITINIFVGVFAFFYFFSTPGVESAIIAFVLLIILAAYGLGIYIILAIYSLYYQIKQASNRLQCNA